MKYKNHLESRINYIDITKGLTIVLVMIGHLSFPMWLINLIYFFHMPLFVMISGILYKPTNFTSLIHSTKKIILSYLFYGMLFIGFSMILRGFKVDDFINLLLAKPGGLFSINFFGIFWFLIALLVIKWLVYFMKPTLIMLALSIIFFLTIPILNHDFSWLINFPFAVFQGLLLLGFYYFGFYYKKIELNGLSIFIPSLLVFSALSYYNINHYDGFTYKIVNYHMLKVNQPFIDLLLAISGSILILQLSKYLDNTKNWLINFVEHMGRYSFVYYALHLFVFFVVNNIFKILKIENFQILIFAFTILLIFLFIKISNKWISNVKLKRIILFQ